MRNKITWLSVQVVLSLLCVAFLSGCFEEEWKVRDPLQIIEGESLEDYLSREKFKGSVIVIEQGEFVINKGFGHAHRKQQITNNSDTVFRLASVTKQFTAMSIMILQEQGLLDIEQPVSDFVEDFPNGDKIRIRHLLTHTSGMIRNFNKSAPKHDVTPLELIALFRSASLLFEPGTDYSYSNAGYKLQGISSSRRQA